MRRDPGQELRGTNFIGLQFNRSQMQQPDKKKALSHWSSVTLIASHFHTYPARYCFLFHLVSEERMSLRLITATLLLSVAAIAADSRAVCPGPVALGAARCHSRVITDKNGNPRASSQPPSTAYGPVQFQTAYTLPSSTAGAGQTIAIVDAYDDPNIQSDLAIYVGRYQIAPTGTFTKVDQTGGTNYPKVNSGWALEISLDVEITRALCPNCNILLVEANSNSLSDLLVAEDYARTQADVVSNSWGGGESLTETNYDIHFASGPAITFSAGDSGYGIEYPAASPNVTAVGGTTLTQDATTTRRWSETVWSGTGSGCSAYEKKPTWQKDTGCSNRTVNDVAADADPNTGAAIYDSLTYHGQSGWYQVGGTSLSSPIVASIYALTGTASGVKDASSLYSAPAGSLFDVTSGKNTKRKCSPAYLCTGEVGYDGPTGNGTPNGTSAF